MTKVILHGYSGKMGQVVRSLVENDAQIEIVAGIDKQQTPAPFPTFETPQNCDVAADVIIDFSIAAAIEPLLKYSAEKKIPVVLCTTGLDESLKEKILEASKQVAILKSANMSLGVNLILNLVQKAAQMLADSGFDMEIIEKHHNQKIDAPSGTALAIADSINEAMDYRYEYCYDRSQKQEKRLQNEIGIHAVRGGTIVGEHDVIFAGKDEIVTFSHTAMSKEIFAVGAIKAAKFLSKKPARLYSMKDVIEG